MNETRNMTEEKVTFNAFSDKSSYTVMDESGEAPVIEISGYDLRTVFNFDKIHSIEDAEDACATLANIFLKAMVQQLLEERVNKTE